VERATITPTDLVDVRRGRRRYGLNTRALSPPPAVAARHLLEFVFGGYCVFHNSMIIPLE